MSNHIDLKYLQSFQVLAEELHFRKAAEKLYISQPGLSKQIQHLETQLGVSLLERDRRNVRLTPSGVYLKTRAKFLSGFLEQTISQIKVIEAGLEGEIRIGFVGSAMQKVIPDLIKKCTATFPNINFVFDEMSNKAQLTALQNNQIDLGFVRLKEVPTPITIRPIQTENFALVIPKNHPIKPSSFKSLKQFAKNPFILFSSDYSSAYYNNIMSIFSDAGFEPKVSHKSIHANTIFRLVENGLGVAIVPISLTLDVEKAIDIQVIQLEKIRQQAILSIAWRKDQHFPALEKVMQFLTSLSKPQK